MKEATEISLGEIIMHDHNKNGFQCRLGCGACCIAPSISSYIPGMPNGKPAGVRCIQLTEDNLCKLFGQKERPLVCGSLKPSKEMCGSSNCEAMEYLQELEKATSAAVIELDGNDSEISQRLEHENGINYLKGI